MEIIKEKEKAWDWFQIHEGSIIMENPQRKQKECRTYTEALEFMENE